jgi:hypothetical protein
MKTILAAHDQSVEQVMLVCFGARALQVYQGFVP